MRRHLAGPTPVLVAVASVAAVVLVGLGSSQATAGPSGGQPVLLRDRLAGFDALAQHAGPEQVDTTVEPSVAVNPHDPNNAVIGFQVGRVDAGGDATNGYAVTFDGGRTWRNGIIPGLTKGHGGTRERASDAVVAFGDHGEVYFSSLVFTADSNNGLESAIVNNTSHDGGRTWGPVNVVQDDLGGGLNDKNWVIVDRSAASGHHPGRVYVVWDRVAGVTAKYSDDQGATWVPASPAYLPNVYASQGIGSYPVVLPNGDLAVAFMADVAPPAITAKPGDELAEVTAGVSKVTIARFVGAGSVPSGAPLPAAVVNGVATFEGNAIRHQRAGGLLAADVDPATGRLYVVWEDARYRSDAANDAVLAYSDDGVTWSAPIRLNRGVRGDLVDHYNPSVAVHADGTVDVMYRQRQETRSSDETDYSQHIDTFVVRSHDHGLTFGAPVKVNRSPSDTRFGAFSRGGLFQGDYDQIATAGGLTYVVRAESYAPSRVAVPPDALAADALHHQTVWVAVLGNTPPGPRPVAAPVPRSAPAGGPALVATGISRGVPLAALVLLGLGLVVRARRGDHVTGANAREGAAPRSGL